MPKIEKSIFLWGKVLFIVGGIMLSSYSFVTTFSDFPPIIKDWRLSVSIGLLFLFIGSGWTIIDLYGKYVWWAEPKIVLTPSKKDSTSPFNEKVVFALLNVYNDEETEITDCYATLEQATILYSGDLIPIELGKKDRLKWAEAKYSTEDCKIAISPKGDNNVHVANSSFHFAFCKDPDFYSKELQGIYKITIRIDGKLNGKDIKPQFFNGHLLMDNVVTESGIYTRIIFESGDWMENQDIPEWYKERKNIQQN